MLATAIIKRRSYNGDRHKLCNFQAHVILFFLSFFLSFFLFEKPSKALTFKLVLCICMVF